MCTAAFMTGLAPNFAAENVGYFTAPNEVRTKLGRLALPNNTAFLLLFEVKS
jgi:hypothetical protein